MHKALARKAEELLTIVALIVSSKRLPPNKPIGYYRVSLCEKPNLDQLAERQGFEPWELVRAQRFSRPPHSTTLAPLHKVYLTNCSKNHNRSIAIFAS